MRETTLPIDPITAEAGGMGAFTQNNLLVNGSKFCFAGYCSGICHWCHGSTGGMGRGRGGIQGVFKCPNAVIINGHFSLHWKQHPDAYWVLSNEISAFFWTYMLYDISSWCFTVLCFSCRKLLRILWNWVELNERCSGRKPSLRKQFRTNLNLPSILATDPGAKLWIYIPGRLFSKVRQQAPMPRPTPGSVMKWKQSWE